MSCLPGYSQEDEETHVCCVTPCNVCYARVPHFPKGKHGVLLFRAVGRLCRMFAGLGPARSVALGRTTVLTEEGNGGPKWPKVGLVGRSGFAAVEGALPWCCFFSVGSGNLRCGKSDGMFLPCGASVGMCVRVASCYHLDR